MATEIERRFFVENLELIGTLPLGSSIRQAYFKATDSLSTSRIRIIDDECARLTIKGPQVGIARPEYEYEIPLSDAEEMMQTLCGSVIYKTRYEIPFHGWTWELDIFEGRNSGLIIAELELSSAVQAIVVPDWIGTEIRTHTLSNYNLSKCSWDEMDTATQTYYKNVVHRAE